MPHTGTTTADVSISHPATFQSSNHDMTDEIDHRHEAQSWIDEVLRQSYKPALYWIQRHHLGQPIVDESQVDRVE